MTAITYSAYVESRLKRTRKSIVVKVAKEGLAIQQVLLRIPATPKSKSWCIGWMRRNIPDWRCNPVYMTLREFYYGELKNP